MDTKIEIVKADFITYGFTVKYNKILPVGTKGVEGGVYFYNKNVFCRWKERYDIVPLMRVFEKDGKGVLHVHGTVEIPKKFYRKNLMVDGFHLKLEEIYNLAQWQSYCMKDAEWVEMIDELVSLKECNTPECDPDLLDEVESPPLEEQVKVPKDKLFN